MNMQDPILYAVEAIRQYLLVRPGAADTLEGIHSWWIDWQGQPESTEVSAAALQKLLQNGEVEKRLVGGREIWRKAR